MPKSLEDRLQAVQLVLSDVDGVLTDGGVVYDNHGIETQRFHIHDGLGIRLWQRAGLRFGVVTSRNSHIVMVRCAELGIELVRQGVDKKLPSVRQLVSDLGLTAEQVCYIGDDLPDLPVIRWAGLGVAVANATPEVRESAAHVTRLAGGEGAVRETLELILRTQRRWDELLRHYET
jgi:3-deoxy-D-manno-octulosonate 8-phosphate phosphatase (KDO 8-P phosphatase)